MVGPGRPTRSNLARPFHFREAAVLEVDQRSADVVAAFRHASRMVVTTRDGRTFEKLALHRRGSPENPLPRDAIVEKFYAVVAPCLARGRAERIHALVDRLETLERLDDLVSLLAEPVELKTR